MPFGRTLDQSRYSPVARLADIKLDLCSTLSLRPLCAYLRVHIARQDIFIYPINPFARVQCVCFNTPPFKYVIFY